MYNISKLNTESVVGGIAFVNTTPPGLNAQQTEDAEQAQKELISGLVDFFGGIWDGVVH
jgi:hypothetical protein